VSSSVRGIIDGVGVGNRKVEKNCFVFWYQFGWCGVVRGFGGWFVIDDGLAVLLA